MGFNQRKPPDRTVCVAVDLSAAFDTVCHNKLLSKINRSPLPPATSRWLSSYLRGRQAKTCFRGVKSSSRKVHAGVPQGSKLSPSLFSFYIADMPTPTEPVKRVCYARHRSAVEPLMIAKDRKTTLQTIHTMSVNQAVTSL